MRTLFRRESLYLFLFFPRSPPPNRLLQVRRVTSFIFIQIRVATIMLKHTAATCLPNVGLPRGREPLSECASRRRNRFFCFYLYGPPPVVFDSLCSRSTMTCNTRVPPDVRRTTVATIRVYIYISSVRMQIRGEHVAMTKGNFELRLRFVRKNGRLEIPRGCSVGKRNYY